MTPVNRNRRQKVAHREVPISYYIPLSHFNSADIFECYDGTQGFVFRLQGSPFELLDTPTLVQQRHALHQALLQLPANAACYLTHWRQRHPPNATDLATAPFAQQFQRAYQEYWREHTLYHNQSYMTVLIKPKSSVTRRFWQYRQDGPSIERRQKQQENAIKLRDILLRLLADYRPRLLRCLPTATAQDSELLSFFGLLINGFWRPMRLPAQALNRYLPERRLLFGFDTVQWYGRHTQEHTFGALLSIKQYSASTRPLILKALLGCDSEYLITHSYQPQSQAATLDNMRKQQAHLRAVNDPAHSQRVELQQARDALGSGELQFGWHHNSVLVMANDLNVLDEKVAHLLSIFQAADLHSVRETLNLESAFWAQIPGNFKYIQRAALISSMNVCDYFQLYNFPSGQRQTTHLKRPVTIFPTRGRTVFHFNFHEPNNGSVNDFSKGHTTLIAPSHAGKTTIMTMLDCCMQQFGGQSIFFDRDRGCEIYVRALGGMYQRIEPDVMTGFNPLQLPAHPVHQHFLQSWLTHLIAGDDNTLAVNIQQEVSQTLERVMQLPQVERQLITFWHLLPTGSLALEKLHVWLRLPQQAPGAWHYLFNSATDQLDVSASVLGFDLTHLLDHAPAYVVTAVLMYMFHRLEMRMDGHLMGIYLDEGWQYLADPFWQTKLRAYLPTLRKKNVYVVFTTQSPGSVVNSALCDELIQGSATNLYLANPKARHDHYVQGFKLSEAEYQFIKTTPPSERSMLIKQQHHSAVVQCHLQPFPQAVAVFSANQASLNRLDRLVKQYGNAPQHWLAKFYQEQGV